MPRTRGTRDTRCVCHTRGTARHKEQRKKNLNNTDIKKMISSIAKQILSHIYKHCTIYNNNGSIFFTTTTPLVLKILLLLLVLDHLCIIDLEICWKEERNIGVDLGHLGLYPLCERLVPNRCGTRLRCIFVFVHAFFNKRHLACDCCYSTLFCSRVFLDLSFGVPSVLPGLVGRCYTCLSLVGLANCQRFLTWSCQNSVGMKGAKIINQPLVCSMSSTYCAKRQRKQTTTPTVWMRQMIL